MISCTANLVYKLLHELANNLRLRILGNKKISGKSQICVETLSSAQSPFQKLNFDNSSQETCKGRYQNMFSFTGFLYFVVNLWPRIVGRQEKCVTNSQAATHESLLVRCSPCALRFSQSNQLEIIYLSQECNL